MNFYAFFNAVQFWLPSKVVVPCKTVKLTFVDEGFGLMEKVEGKVL